MGQVSSTHSLLIADDDAAFAEVIATVAKELGFKVTHVDDGSRVAETVADIKPSVIALDMCMPETDGVEVIRDLSSIHCASGILLMSGLGESILNPVADLGRQKGLNISATFAKPVSIEMIQEALKPYLNVCEDEEDEEPNRKPIFEYGLNIQYQPELPSNPIDEQEKHRVRMELGYCTDYGMQISGSRLLKWIEEIGMSKGLLRSAMTQLCRAMKRWEKQQFSPAPVVPVSEPVLRDLELPDFLEAAANQFGIKPGQISIEVEERLLTSQDSLISDVLSRTRIKGFRLSVSASGVGENILSLLDKFPIDQIVLDASEIKSSQHLGSSSELEFHYSSLVMAANARKIQVCASDVNTESALVFTHNCKINSICGREVARPLSAEKVPDFFKQANAVGRNQTETENANGLRALHQLIMGQN